MWGSAHERRCFELAALGDELEEKSKATQYAAMAVFLAARAAKDPHFREARDNAVSAAEWEMQKRQREMAAANATTNAAGSQAPEGQDQNSNKVTASKKPS